MEKLLGQNWITKLGGWIGVAAVAVSFIPQSVDFDRQGWALFLASVGTAIAGFGAKDYNVHSTTQEVKTSTAEKKEDESK